MSILGHYQKTLKALYISFHLMRNRPLFTASHIGGLLPLSLIIFFLPQFSFVIQGLVFIALKTFVLIYISLLFEDLTRTLPKRLR